MWIQWRVWKWIVLPQTPAHHLLDDASVAQFWCTLASQPVSCMQGDALQSIDAGRESGGELVVQRFTPRHPFL